MPNSDDRKSSAREKQIAKIEQLKKQLQNEEAKLRSQARKDRNTQLVAFGIYMEAFLRDNPKNFSSMASSMKKYATGKILERCLAGLDRLSKEKVTAQPKKEISPEPPSQLPEAEAQEKNQGSA